MHTMRSLSTLIMSGCNIREFRSEVRDMKPLQSVKQVVWSMISTPKKGPQTFWVSLPFSLRELNLSDCNLSDDSFPDSFGNTPSLSLLDLSRNPFRRLPNGMKSITGRLHLYTSYCEKLQLLDFDGLQGGLAGLTIVGCSTLEKVISIDSDYFLFSGCSKLDEVENYYKRSSRELFGMDVDMTSNSLPHFLDQITLEFGISSLIRNGGKFSSASSYEKREDSSISFTVPLLATHPIIQYLNVFCTYNFEIKDDADAREEFDILSYFGDIYVKIKNKTKNLTWIYNPDRRFPSPRDKDRYEWRSKWRFGNQLDGGDEVTVAFYPIRKHVQN